MNIPDTMKYVPLSILYVGPTAANHTAQGVIEPNWGVGQPGWYLVDEKGDGVFGPFAEESGAEEELRQLQSDLDRGIA